MRQIPELESTDARRILDAAVDSAAQAGFKVSIAVVDAGGHPLAFYRLPDTAAATAAIALSKARTAALVGRDTKHYEEMINKGRPAFLSAPGLEAKLEGGVPIEVDGRCIGAVGVSGVLPAQDADVARAGIAKLQE